ncbi:MAG: sodium:solute symporter family transporter [Opitutaceae bacterium]
MEDPNTPINSVSSEIGAIDISIIIIYLLGIVALGCWAGLRKKKHAGASKAQEYFLAGGSLKWPVIGLALFATNISTVHLVSLAQSGFDFGLAYGNFEWMAVFTLLILALFFAPFFVRAKVATLPDFLEKRYNRPCRDMLTVLSIVSAIFIHIGFALFTGAVVLNGMFGFSITHSIIGVALITGLYTVVGGLMAVVLTESIQTIILLLGAIILTAISWVKVGGWGGITGYVDPIQLTMLRPSGDSSNLPWYSVLLGFPVLGIWYWCTDQTIVQRVLAAKDENEARLGAIFAGFIKILPVFIFILPGLMCSAMLNQGILDSSSFPAKVLESGEIVKDTSGTYAYMVRELLPVGVKGIVAAALLSALMSTVSGALNSISTLFSYDLLKRLRPETSDQSLVFAGRVVAVIAMIVAILWSTNIDRFQNLMEGFNSVIGNIAPPITTVFLFGVFWKRASAFAAQWTLYIGTVMGATVFAADMMGYKIFGDIPFLMVPFYLFCICSVVMVSLSCLKPHVHTAESAVLFWKTPLEPLSGVAGKGLKNYKLLSLILFVTMLVLFYSFSRELLSF